MKSLKFILVLIFCYGSSRSSAQTASLYSAKRLVGVYSTIQAAVDAAMPYDSIVLSADVFIENDILFRYDRFPLRINGTVNKTDTTRININKKSKVFINFLGNLSNVIIENIDTIISKRPFPNCSISLSGYISFRNSIFNYSPLFYDLYEISNCHFDFSKNIISIRNELPPYEIPNYLILIDYFTKVSNSNFNVNYNNIIYPKKLAVIQIETEIDNIGIDIFKNIGGVGLYLGPGFHHLESVITQSFKHVNIYSNSFNSGKDYASLNIYSGDLSKKFNLIINNSYIYNPAPVGQKRIELYCDNSANLSFESSDTWWGSSDTAGLFAIKAPSSFKLHSWAKTHWYAVPYGKSPFTLTNVRADIRRSDGTAFADSSFRAMRGDFYASGGYFSPASAAINPANVVASDYHLPATGPYSVMAVIDADTFKPSNEKLGIVEGSVTTNLHIYPNPATEQITIEELPIGSSVQLIDLKGRCLLQEQSHTEPYTLSLKGIAPAYYLLQVQSPSGAKSAVKIQVE